MAGSDAYRDMFLAESGDFVQQITDGLLELEREPHASEPVELIFRGAHSLKGMAAAMGYDRTADLTHKMEGLMDRVRKGERGVDRELVDVMLAAVDLVRDVIDDESHGRSEVDTSGMLDTLVGMTAAGATPPAEQGADAPGGPGDVDLREDERLYRVVVEIEHSCVLKAVRAYMVLKRLGHVGRVVDTVPSARDIEDENFDRRFTVMLATSQTADTVRDAALPISEIASADVDDVTPVREEARLEGAPVRPRRNLPRLSESQTVRVAIGHLDALVDLVGELIILRSRLERLSADGDDTPLKETVDDLHRITAELQYEVMQTRMVPVGNIFNRFPRMVRDLAAELGKDIDFEVGGLDIELDRTVLDEISDPIVHLLRNAIDHGIEAAEVRGALGKPTHGSVRLTAARERDHVAIVVSDDGKGIDLERVWTKAVQVGLARGDARDEYNDAEVLAFTCVPGFSTAERATKVSGRGVGMDVVKGKIEHLGGTLQIQSTPGTGTDFILRLPLTLAIVRALLVESRGQTFALPLSAVNEAFAAEELQVETIDASPVVVLRDGAIVPLHRLDAILFGAEGLEAPAPRSSVVLVAAGGEQHALHVDALVGRQEVVVKPLTRLLQDTRGFSGATILGDGRVMLILDPRTLFTPLEDAR